MLFSATLSKNVKDLARLSLKKEPVYVGVHDTQDVATAAGLEQGYVVCPSELRFLLLFTFLKKNIKKKVIVFFSSCNAVKFYAELLNYIDIPVAKLHRGTNRLVLTQTRNQGAASHVMYDYLALELPEEAPARSEARR